MKNQDLFDLFKEELEDIYSAEVQITVALPKLIKQTSITELKEALSKHLKETENQIQRIEKIFSNLGVKPSKRTCKGMEGLLKEADELIKNKSKSPILDSAIISAAQKVEHYEIASYGTLRSFATHLDLESEVINLLQDTLDEEGAADKKLTKIAEGSLFTNGVNQEAADAGQKHKR